MAAMNWICSKRLKDAIVECELERGARQARRRAARFHGVIEVDKDLSKHITRGVCGVAGLLPRCRVTR